MGAAIEIEDASGAASCRINRKSAAETKGIQHGSSRSQRARPAAILPLIEKEAGFLSANHIRFKPQSGLLKKNCAFDRVAAQRLPIPLAILPVSDRLYVAAEAKDDPLWRKSLLENRN